jgi:hypothetical protein
LRIGEDSAEEASCEAVTSAVAALSAPAERFPAGETLPLPAPAPPGSLDPALLTETPKGLSTRASASEALGEAVERRKELAALPGCLSGVGT